MNKEVAFENGLERPIEAWKPPRVLIDLDHVQRASLNSKPFWNAASFVQKKCLFNFDANVVPYKINTTVNLLNSYGFTNVIKITQLKQVRSTAGRHST